LNQNNPTHTHTSVVHSQLITVIQQQRDDCVPGVSWHRLLVQDVSHQRLSPVHRQPLHPTSLSNSNVPLTQNFHCNMATTLHSHVGDSRNHVTAPAAV